MGRTLPRPAAASESQRLVEAVVHWSGRPPNPMVAGSNPAGGTECHSSGHLVVDVGVDGNRVVVHPRASLGRGLWARVRRPKHRVSATVREAHVESAGP